MFFVLFQTPEIYFRIELVSLLPGRTKCKLICAQVLDYVTSHQFVVGGMKAIIILGLKVI